MRKGLRLALAAATGAAVLVTGATVTVASPAMAAIAAAAETSIGTPTFTDSFIPPAGSSTIPFKATISATAWVSGKAPKVAAVFYKDGEVTTGSGTPANVTEPTAPATGASPSTTVDLNGSVPISSSDKPGKWKLKITVDPEGSASALENTTEFTVVAATRVTGMDVNPNPVYLKSGKEVDVYANFKLEKQGDEKVTSVQLESKSANDSYSLPSGLEADDSYNGSTAFDYQTSTGAWQLNVTVQRGTKKYSFVKNFEVKKSSSKAKSKITLYASPSKVKKGKTTKLYGKVYRGSKAWSKKILKLYFKKKGTSKYKFVGYIGATSTGKYAKVVKPKYDGYWRTTASGTSATYGSLSNIKFVDVR